MGLKTLLKRPIVLQVKLGHEGRTLTNINGTAKKLSKVIALRHPTLTLPRQARIP